MGRINIHFIFGRKLIAAGFDNLKIKPFLLKGLVLFMNFSGYCDTPTERASKSLDSKLKRIK